MRQFLLYATIGIANTILHWIVFFGVFYLIFKQQDISNCIAFFISASFSYIVNSKLTFNKNLNISKYFLFIIIMGCLSFSFGYFADVLNISPIIMVLSFSLFSLIIGFLCSKYLVFK